MKYCCNVVFHLIFYNFFRFNFFLRKRLLLYAIILASVYPKNMANFCKYFKPKDYKMATGFLEQEGMGQTPIFFSFQFLVSCISVF